MRLALATLLPALALAAVLLAVPAEPADGASATSPGATRVSAGVGEIVPIPASIPHQEGAMIDRRLIPNLRWLHKRFPFYVTEGYAGPLRGYGTVGCPDCHVSGSDHHYGLAVDLAAPSFSTTCDGSWRALNRLARWAEPRQNRPVAPFRWVGYDGDAGHGCGHHLHLSWNHADGRPFRVASWVQVFKVRFQGVAEHPRGGNKDKPPPRNGPSGGVSPVETGGVGADRVLARMAKDR